MRLTTKGRFAVTAMIDPQQGSSVDIEALREMYGLNRPLPVRYAIWLKEVVAVPAARSASRRNRPSILGSVRNETGA